MAINIAKLKKAELKNIQWKDIFLSTEYRIGLESMINVACRKVGYKGKIPALSVLNDPNSEDIACTDGNIIYVNFGSKFAVRLKTKPVQYHIFIVGLIAHELGHVFWTGAMRF